MFIACVACCTAIPINYYCLSIISIIFTMPLLPITQYHYYLHYHHFLRSLYSTWSTVPVLPQNTNIPLLPRLQLFKRRTRSWDEVQNCVSSHFFDHSLTLIHRLKASDKSKMRVQQNGSIHPCALWFQHKIVGLQPQSHH